MSPGWSIGCASWQHNSSVLAIVWSRTGMTAPDEAHHFIIGELQLSKPTECLAILTQQGPGLLTLWGRVTHICVCKLTIIGSDNGLSPGRCQAIIWTNGGILLIGPLGTNFSEILIKIYSFSFKKMHLKMSGKWRPSWLGLNVLRDFHVN